MKNKIIFFLGEKQTKTEWSSTPQQAWDGIPTTTRERRQQVGRNLTDWFSIPPRRSRAGAQCTASPDACSSHFETSMEEGRSERVMPEAKNRNKEIEVGIRKPMDVWN